MTADEQQRPHDFHEDAADGSMCVCGVPATEHWRVEQEAADTIVNLASIPILAGLVTVLYLMRHQIGAVVEAKTIELKARYDSQQAWTEGYAQGYEDATEPYPTHGWER